MSLPERWDTQRHGRSHRVGRVVDRGGSVVSVFAGLFHLKWPIVLLLSTVSALIWNGLLIYGGYQLGVNWTVLTGIISEYNKFVLAVTVLIIIFVIYKKLQKRSLRKKNL